MSQRNKYTSRFDPSRETVGKIYRDLQINSDHDSIQVGDMANAIIPDLVQDINDGLATKPYGDAPFYLMVHEKKDLQMRTALLRRILFFPNHKRPWPEDDTTVFWKDPKTQEVKFCWCLPHWSEMDNILMNPTDYEPDYVEKIISWKKYDLIPFGFYYHKKLKWVPNPKFKDKSLETKPISSSNILVSSF